MTDTPEGWITRIENGTHKYINVAPQDTSEPIIKYFDNKIIYIPSEVAKYESEVLKKGHNVIWLGTTGWTKPPKHYAERYGANNEDKIYESLVCALLMENIVNLKRNNIEVDLRHGASDAGVDAATMKVMETIPVSGSGVNCPLYMSWVTDDTRGGPVLVAEDKNTYHGLYAKYNQILLVTGGRDVAFNHDYLHRLRGEGYSVVADVIQTISKHIIPGIENMPGQDKAQLNNAAAYIREKNSFTYSPVPRTFEELSIVTQLSVLDNAYKILKWIPDNKSLSQLEQKYLEAKQRYKEPTPITKAELEHKIDAAKKEYMNLL